MKKMLIADNTEVNSLILHEIFGAQYELIRTESSDGAFRLMMQYRGEIAIVLINESIARHITPETAQTLQGLRMFDNIPVVVILNKESGTIRPQKMNLPYSDVINSPVNPYIAKQRIENLVELFSHKSELENLVNDQTKKILEQNKTLEMQQKKINTINNDMLDTLSTVIEYRDVESGKHIHRIRKFTEVLLRSLSENYPKYNLTEEKIQLITSASSIHDIGKIAIPDSILLSPRRLTFEEFKIMKQHTIKGCEILEQLDAVERNEYYTYCYDICRYHHEKWDGLGYPDGLAGDEIPICAQVVSLADCYDALTSERPYKAAFTHEQAVEMIRDGACGAFSEEMMDCFGRVLPEFRDLAREYADVSHSDRIESDGSYNRFIKDGSDDHSRDIYIMMDRTELIDTIEHQKEIIDDTHRRECEALYRSADYVFEFDLIHDMLHERSGSFKNICGYVPKNYEEAVNVMSDICTDKYKNIFLRELRMQSIEDAVENEDDRCTFEGLMNIGDMRDIAVRCTAVPVVEEDRISRIFVSISVLHKAGFSSRSDTEDTDAVTSLRTYTGMKKEIEDYLQHTGKNGYHMLVLIDVDNFRSVNRKTNYRFGNEILCDIADGLRMRVSENSVIGRIEDDNFLVFIRDCPDREERERIVDELFSGIHKTYIFGNERIPDISASVAVAVYPDNGQDFDTLFLKASRAVELAKLNGKNMYLFYNERMSDNYELIRSDDGSGEASVRLSVISDRRYFIPVADASSGRIISYDLTEMHDNSDAHNDDNSGTGTSAYGLSSIRHLIATIHELEKGKIALPEITVYTVFNGKQYENIIKALGDILDEYPVNCHDICLMLTHDMVASLSAEELAAFAGALRDFGFRLGVYNVGLNNIDIKCFTDQMFAEISFSSEFVNNAAEGVYPLELIVYMIGYFNGIGTRVVFPLDTPEDLTDILRQKSDIRFDIHRQEFITLDEFIKQMKISSVVVEYPILSHEHNELVLSERVYDEILEQTGSFIMEWTPRSDSIKLTGSFQKMYGYMPETENFARNIRDRKYVHNDDIKKLLERINSARSDNADSESFIRIYSLTGDTYVWNRVRFVTLKNASEIPIKVIAVFVDVSDEHDTPVDEQRSDRTDFITNLYNKRATENKIKRYLYDEGVSGVHSLIIVEICGFETLEKNLGSVFANAVLKQAAGNIKELFRDSDIIGRSSGSRFTVFVKGISGYEKIKEKARQICAVINSKYQSESGDVRIYGKAGISMFPMGGSTYDELYSEALRALYFAKHSVKQDIVLSAEMNSSHDIKRLTSGEN